MLMRFLLNTIAFIILIAAQSPIRSAQVTQCSSQSGDQLAALLELYTSEGCSSCPPADRWVNNLKGNGLSSSQVVPLSLHVDYWNYIGWKDPFSKAQYTQRQRYFGRINRLSSIYTPQMMLNGRDFRGWRRGSAKSAIRSINQHKPKASITINTRWASPDNIVISTNALVPLPSDRTNVQLNIAVFENNLRSRVLAGENNGRRLEHNYVVRKLFTTDMIDNQGQLKHNTSLLIPKDWKRKDLGVAAFVQNIRNGDVYQAWSVALACEN